MNVAHKNTDDRQTEYKNNDCGDININSCPIQVYYTFMDHNRPGVIADHIFIWKLEDTIM